MNVTEGRFKNRQLHIEDYLQMVSAEHRVVGQYNRQKHSWTRTKYGEGFWLVSDFPKIQNVFKVIFKIH